MSVEPLQPFDRPSIGGGGMMKIKRKGDDLHGWGGKGLGESETRASSRRGKVLKPGTFGAAAGRTFAVLEVGETNYRLELRALMVGCDKRCHPLGRIVWSRMVRWSYYYF